MKNAAVQAESVMTNDELESVKGGMSFFTYFSGKVTIVGPVVRPNDNFLFGADFDYPKGPVEQPR